MVESDVWVPLAAAFLAAGLTAVSLIGLEWWRKRTNASARLREDRVHAYSRLLAVTGLIINTTTALRQTVETRSGWQESVSLILRLRRPIEPLDVDRRLREDLVPLYQAWTDVLTVGSPAAVDIANRAVLEVGEVIAQGVQYPQGVKNEFRRAVVGVRWTSEERSAWKAYVEKLADTRRDLAELARLEVGVEPADIFPSTPTAPGTG